MGHREVTWATRPRPLFLTDTQILWTAVAAAVCSFILTTLNPQKAARAFVNAYRHLEKAISRHRFNPAPDLRDLSEAEREGIDMLN